MADAPTLPTYTSGLLWAKAYRILRGKVSETLEKYHLTMTEWALLGKLYDANTDGVHLADVATALGVEPPLVTTMVSQLEKKGLVGRKEDVRDRRAKFISLTDESRELVPRIEEAMQRTQSALLSGLTEQEITTFVRVLDVLVKNAR
jgi:MarR family transcriptional regulator for hemolysin